mmetsp:Transcript_15033/g.35816  ORF Transcript_15033/g.35816 Transcript_15033/m.35816 type:complete len:227 (-) Transcript_15033:370-1050(-)
MSPQPVCSCGDAQLRHEPPQHQVREQRGSLGVCGEAVQPDHGQHVCHEEEHTHASTVALCVLVDDGHAQSARREGIQQHALECVQGEPVAVARCRTPLAKAHTQTHQRLDELPQCDHPPPPAQPLAHTNTNTARLAWCRLSPLAAVLSAGEYDAEVEEVGEGEGDEIEQHEEGQVGGRHHPGTPAVGRHCAAEYAWQWRGALFAVEHLDDQRHQLQDLAEREDRTH